MGSVSMEQMESRTVDPYISIADLSHQSGYKFKLLGWDPRTKKKRRKERKRRWK